MNAKRQAEKRKPPIFNVFGVTRSEIEPRPPAPRADALTTVLRRGGDHCNGVWLFLSFFLYDVMYLFIYLFLYLLFIHSYFHLSIFIMY